MKYRAILVGLVLVIAASVRCLAQDASFEVASVRPDPNPQHGESLILSNPGQFFAGHITVEHLLLFAYGLRGNQLSGGPAWIHSETFQVSAKIADDTWHRIEQLDGKGRYDAYRAMVRRLLVDRFHLRIVESSSMVRGYVLGVAEGGNKLSPAGDGFGAYMHSGVLSCKFCTMESLIDVLSETLDAPVYDRTGLTGHYDVSLEWEETRTTPEQELSQNIVSVRPSLRQALKDQLGLTLHPEQVSTKVINILAVSHPDAN